MLYILHVPQREAKTIPGEMRALDVCILTANMHSSRSPSAKNGISLRMARTYRYISLIKFDGGVSNTDGSEKRFHRYFAGFVKERSFSNHTHLTSK